MFSFAVQGNCKSLKMLFLQCLSDCVNLYVGLFALGFLFIWVFGMFFVILGSFFFLFCRGAECCLLWQRPVEIVVHFRDAKFYEMQNTLKKITPETLQVWYLKLMETLWPYCVSTVSLLTCVVEDIYPSLIKRVTLKINNLASEVSA